MLRYKNYSLIKPDNAVCQQINQLVVHKNGSVFHEIELNKIIAESFNSDLLCLVDNPEKIQHAALVHILKKRFGARQYILRPLYDIPYAGFIGEGSINLKDFRINLFESFSYAGFPYNKKEENKNRSNFGETSMIDLSMDENEIFNTDIHSKRRNMIRKAINVGIEIKQYFSTDGFDIFWPMLDGLHKKLGYLKLGCTFYKNLFKYYSERKQSFILIAYKDKIPVSGVLILGNANFMHYYKGASADGAKNEGQGELLQWEAIKLSKKLGSLKYDLCNLDKEKHPSIYRFKTGISKKMYQYQSYSHSSTGFKVINRLAKHL